MPDIYRPCSSIVVFRSGENTPRILLLHKPRRNDAWQLPQGGVDEGETFKQAALRELKEEAGIAAGMIVESSIIYKYDFPASYRRFRADNVVGQNIKFFFGVAGRKSEVKVDKKEIDGFKWVSAYELKKYIRRRRYLDVVRRLFEEGEELLND